MRRGRVLVVFAALLLAGCASHHRQQSGAGTKRTVTKIFHAYRANGDLAVRVADVATGHCWTTSIAAPMSDGYRCLADNEILDPCFAPPHPVTPLEVACVANPWSQAEVLQLSGALPSPAPDGKRPGRPWAIELDNGVRCVAATGTIPDVRGVNLGYHCLDGWAAGLIDTTGPLVSAHYGDPQTNALEIVTVATMWRV